MAGLGTLELVAKFPAVYGTDQIVQALQTLLTERFQLTTHRGSKEMPVYGLVVGKGGLKMKQSEVGPGGTSISKGKLRATRVPMGKLADVISTQLDRPVVDMTGVSGVFDFTLEWAQDPNEVSDTGPTADIYSAIQQQLGLKLEMRKAPVETLIVDRGEKEPIGN